MAALRHGVHTVIIPAENEKDLEEIDQTVRKALNFITVSHMDAVLDAALDFSPCSRPSLPLAEPIGELKVKVKPDTGKKQKTGVIRQ